MKKWIEITDLRTGKPALVNTDHIRCVSAALQPGNTYGLITIGELCVLTKEPYSELKSLIKDAVS